MNQSPLVLPTPYYLEPGLRQEIQTKHDALKNHKRYPFKLQTGIARNLQIMGALYSWWLENPDIRIDLVKEEKSEEEIRQMAQVGFGRIMDAWGNLRRYNFQKAIPIEAVIETGHLIDEANLQERMLSQGKPRFRKKNIYSNLGVPAASYESVERDVERTLDVANYSAMDAIEKAIFLHANIARIQPFEHGNKRVGRLLQNKFLVDHQFDIQPILPGEREHYVHLLTQMLIAQQSADHRRLEAYKEHINGRIELPEYASRLEDAYFSVKGNALEAHRNFYSFIGCKINSGLDEILNDLNSISPKHHFRK